MDDLFNKLKEYGESDYYPFHMPGHKRQMKDSDIYPLYQRDITEIDGFDNLHHATGIILDAEKRAARLYGSNKTYFLVNGSTCGILTAIHTTVKPGGKILMARNCHKAAYHGALIRSLQIEYLYPGWNEEFQILTGIHPRDVEEALSLHPDIEAVFITSPTFDGVVSDVEEIAKISHRYGVPLIVDEAHGAHFGLFPKSNTENYKIPEHSIAKGGDLVIHSLHKTLPSLTQTALLHVNGDLVDTKLVEKYLSVFQTSSPSYLLMASIDRCIVLLENQGQKLYKTYLQQIEDFYQQCENLKNLRVMGKKNLMALANPIKRSIIEPVNDAIGMDEEETFIIQNKTAFRTENTIFDWDFGKIIISVKKTSLSGQTLYDILREKYHLQLEMAAPSYALAIVTIMDSKEGFKRLADALKDIDGMLSEEYDDSDKLNTKDSIGFKAKAQGTLLPGKKAKLTIAQAELLDKTEVLWKDAIGKVSGEWVSIYPPGIPFLVPGEIIDKATVEEIEKAILLGLPLQGLSHTNWVVSQDQKVIENGTILIVSQESNNNIK